MLTNEAKRKLTAAGVFAFPVVLVWLTGEMFGGPTAAQAGPAIADPSTQIPIYADPNAGPADPATEAALLHIAYLLEQPYGTSPLYHVPKGLPTPTRVDTPQVPGSPTFTVNAVLGSARGNTALIDGESYEVGDALADSDWTIIEIDALRRSVTIEEPETGRTVRRYVDLRFVPSEPRVEDEGEAPETDEGLEDGEG